MKSSTNKAISKASVYKRYNKKRNKDRDKRNSRLHVYAKRLNKNLPKSEQWFDALFKDHPLYKFFEKNQVVNNYIVDLLCYDKKIVIEIDGSYHERVDQQVKDFYKEQKLIYKGYKVIRVKAYDDASYQACINALIAIFE